MSCFDDTSLFTKIYINDIINMKKIRKEEKTMLIILLLVFAIFLIKEASEGKVDDKVPLLLAFIPIWIVLKSTDKYSSKKRGRGRRR